MSEYTNPCIAHGFNDCCNVPRPVHTHEECIDSGTHEGEVEYRMALSGTGRSYLRCDKHWSERLDVQEGINRRYPDSPMAPADFDPDYAGERWDDDY